MKLLISPVNSRMKAPMITLFSNDPGTANYGYAVVQTTKVKNKIRFQVLENGLCPSTVKNLKDVREHRQEVDAYMAWAQGIKDRYEPDAVCIERFMTRGIKGPTVECVNQMIGGLEMGVFYGTPLKMMPAATWKNAVTRSGVDLNATYKVARVTPHQLDACLIGIYTGHQGFGVKDFGETDLPKVLNKLLDQIEATSTYKLANRKMKR